MKKITLSFLVTIITAIASAQAQRLVLIEQFSNASCPTCGTYSPQVSAYVHAHTADVVMITYHTNFPHFDSLYNENPLEVNNRVAFYNVTGAPQTIIDGNYFNGSSSQVVATLGAKVTARDSVAPDYSVAYVYNQIDNDTLKMQIIYTSLNANNATENLKTRIAVVEEPVFKSDYNGFSGSNSETSYPFAMRKMLPDANGVTLVNKALNGVDTVTLAWPIRNFKRISNLRVVAFVQNETTREIYQSSIAAAVDVTGVNKIQQNKNEIFTLYPSVSKLNFTVHFASADHASRLTVFDLIGNKVAEESINKGTAEKTLSTENLSSGIYLVQVVTSNNTSQTKKLVIAK